MQNVVRSSFGVKTASVIHPQRAPDTCSTHAAPQLRTAPRNGTALHEVKECRSWRVHATELNRGNFSYANRQDSLPNLRQDLQQQLQSLSRTAAILPGSMQEKARIGRVLLQNYPSINGNKLFWLHWSPGYHVSDVDIHRLDSTSIMYRKVGPPPTVSPISQMNFSQRWRQQIPVLTQLGCRPAEYREASSRERCLLVSILCSLECGISCTPAMAR